MKRKNTFITVFLAFLSLLSPSKVFAQATQPSSQGLGCGGGMGPIADFVCSLSGNQAADRIAVGTRLNKLLSFLIGFLTIIAGLWFVFQFILAGYKWISSGGDKSKVETAQKQLTYNAIGLGVVAAAWIITGVIGKVLGLDILNPGLILQTLGL